MPYLLQLLYDTLCFGFICIYLFQVSYLSTKLYELCENVDGCLFAWLLAHEIIHKLIMILYTK